MKSLLSILIFTLLNTVSIFYAIGGENSLSLHNKSNHIILGSTHSVYGIATGVHLNKHPMIELGYSKYSYGQVSSYGSSYTLENYFINDLIIAPKANYWANLFGVNVGFSVPWYFNFHGDNSIKFRPEIGIGYAAFKINYSANISITNRDMKNIGTHFLSINYYIRLKEKEKLE
ncbi:MAG: hypothetical protein GY827_11195 [Cytophagales bacterium]|nr:hypothetical protein [Cytophagales bacterium]